MKKCPFCAEEIQDDATICRFCQRDLTPPAPAQLPAIPNRNLFYIASLGMIAGAFLPWIQLHKIGLSGIEGDGIITLILGCLIGLLALNYTTKTRKYIPVLVILLSIGTILVAIDKILFIASNQFASTGIGLVVTAITGFLGIIAAIKS